MSLESQSHYGGTLYLIQTTSVIRTQANKSRTGPSLVITPKLSAHISPDLIVRLLVSEAGLTSLL